MNVLPLVISRVSLSGFLVGHVFGGSPAMAHPHAWIDLRSTLVLSADERIVAIEQEWLFDVRYTAYAIRRLDSSSAEFTQALRDVAQINLQQLKPHGYFVNVRAEGTKIAVGEVAEFETTMRDGRLWFRFVAPLEIDPKEQKVVLSIFDPTYYVEMLHRDARAIGFRGAGATSCSSELQRPTPSAEAVMLAYALDRDAKPAGNLGAMFAEEILIACQ